MITATTRVAAVIGHPVVHSLSPALHSAGFASLGVDWAYAAFDVAPGEAAAALAAMRTLGLAGLSVTMPHKTDVAGAVDRLDPAAAALRSANTVSRAADGALVGHSTDGDGLLASLAEAGVSVAGAACCVVGAGGAARSIIDALGRAGAAGIAVINRDATRRDLAVASAPQAEAGAADAVGDAQIVINATSVGMSGDLVDQIPLDPGHLRSGQVVVDIVYRPLETALLRAARQAGATTVDGLGMLVHQAALQEQIWLGMMPDVQAMRRAVQSFADDVPR